MEGCVDLETPDSILVNTNLKVLVLYDFWLTVKAATLIFISGCVSAISSAQEWTSGSIFFLQRVNKLFEQTCVHFMKILTITFINI